MTINNKPNRAGLEEQYSPRTAGQKSLHTNTDLCVELKTFLRHDNIAKLGKDYKGVLRHDNTEHFTFMESLPTTTVCKRNPHVYVGRFITVTLNDDGSYQPHFRKMELAPDATVYGYAEKVQRELIEAFEGLVEKS